MVSACLFAPTCLRLRIIVVDDSVVTRPSLLMRLRDARDEDAWREFAEIYGPLVYRYCRKNNLQDADAADLVQEVMRSVSGAIGRLDYDRNLGRFRGWLLTIATNRLRNWIESRGRHPQGTGDSDMQEQLANISAEDETFWDREYEQRVFEWAAERVKATFQESTWAAFWMTAVEAREPKDVAEQLGISVGAVHIAKSRVLARIKEQVERIGDR